MNRAIQRGTLAAFAATTLLAAVCLSALAREGDAPANEPPPVPLGLPPVYWPEDNEYSRDKAELGRLLYFDNRLSSDRSISCASCHAPDKAYTDGSPFSTGINKALGGRSAPTVINRAYSTLQFWDGRARSLEEQAIGPLANPLEMTAEKNQDEAHAAVVRNLRAIPGYITLFAKAFPDVKSPTDLTIDHVAKAIATFERTIYSGNAPYDRYQNGDDSALTPAQARGMDVFLNKGKCDSCHLGFNFTDGSYENIGIGMNRPNPDLGRYKVTQREDEKGAFKTPTLREVAFSAPYMHDGSLKTLEEVVDYYDRGGNPNPWLDERIKPLHLTAAEKADLVEFLKTALAGEGWQHVKVPTTEEFPR